MTKFKSLLAVVSVTFILLWVVATAVLAQEEVPPSYAGLKNPFPWTDVSAQETGKSLYQESCQSCHGVAGSNIGADFSTADYRQSLEERSDFPFWILSEGNLANGMPPYKSSLSEEQRWQVLTYMWSLSTTVIPSDEATPPIEGGLLLLSAPDQAQSGQPITLSTFLQDSQGKPIGNATVKFFINMDFFTSSLVEIGKAVTNDQGIAVLEYSPKQTGATQIVARYKAIETTTTVNLSESSEPFYQVDPGLGSHPSGEGDFTSSGLDVEPGEEAAPMTSIPLSGGTLPSELVIVDVIFILIWGFYFRAMYQVLHISTLSKIGGGKITRYVPWIGLTMVVIIGAVLVLMISTGPYTHLHLP